MFNLYGLDGGDGKFYFRNVNIYNNKLNSDYGIVYAERGKVYLGGKIIIKDNTDTLGANATNLKANDNLIYLGDTDYPLESESNIYMDVVATDQVFYRYWN